MIVNKGGIVERIVRTKIGISELSRILNVSRTSIYNWFEQENLNIETICKIGHAINHDFANEFPADFAKEGHQIMTDLITGKLDQQQHYNNSVQYWMNKYIILLEKHTELLNQISVKSDSPDHFSGGSGRKQPPSMNPSINLTGLVGLGL